MARERILVVEDEPNLQLLYTQELLGQGYTVRPVSNAAEAVSAIEECRPDLVIMDIRMPGMDGIEAMGRILNRDRSLPIILHTAYSCYKDNFCTWVASAYVVKSSNLDPLKETVRLVLDELPERTASGRPPGRAQSFMEEGAAMTMMTGRPRLVSVIPTKGNST